MLYFGQSDNQTNNPVNLKQVCLQRSDQAEFCITILNFLFGLFVFLPFCIFVFLSRHHSDQISEGSEVSKVTLCVEILKWR